MNNLETTAVRAAAINALHAAGCFSLTTTLLPQLPV